MRKTAFPATAIVLIHRFDKPGFLSWLTRLDAVVYKNPQHHFFVYDAAPVDSERLDREDIQRIRTPMRLLYGSDQSVASMYNAIFRTIPAHFDWVLLLDQFVLAKNWQKQVLPLVTKKQYGMWKLTPKSSAFGCLINRTVLQSLYGFEERYFFGSMVMDDLVWRIKQIKKKVGAITVPIGKEISLFKPKMNHLAERYYAVRNDWLFARLRLSRRQALPYLLSRLWREGLLEKGFWDQEYRQAMRDGWHIYTK